MNGNGQPRILAVGEELPPLNAGERRPPKPSKAKGPTRAGRFQTINAFLDVTMAGLIPSERAAWLILWRDTKRDGLARTSQADLARRAGITDRQIRKALAGLQRKGLLTIVHRGGLRRGSTVYRVHPLIR
jgi:hypothetical protein